MLRERSAVRPRGRSSGRTPLEGGIPFWVRCRCSLRLFPPAWFCPAGTDLRRNEACTSLFNMGDKISGEREIAAWRSEKGHESVEESASSLPLPSPSAIRTMQCTGHYPHSQPLRAPERAYPSDASKCSPTLPLKCLDSISRLTLLRALDSGSGCRHPTCSVTV
jgi:hypothetical protein